MLNRSTHVESSDLPGSLRRAHPSRRHRRLIEPTTVRLPAIRTDARPCAARGRARFRRTSLQPRMGAMTVIVPLEIEIERFFVTITTRRIRRGTFDSVPALEATIESYLVDHNQPCTGPRPLTSSWTRSAGFANELQGRDTRYK